MPVIAQRWAGHAWCYHTTSLVTSYTTVNLRSLHDAIWSFWTTGQSVELSVVPFVPSDTAKSTEKQSNHRNQQIGKQTSLSHCIATLSSTLPFRAAICLESSSYNKTRMPLLSSSSMWKYILLQLRSGALNHHFVPGLVEEMAVRVQFDDDIDVCAISIWPWGTIQDNQRQRHLPLGFCNPRKK